MDISSYQKSLWVRNALLVLFSIALIAVAVKIGLGIKKITLYEQAREYYEADDLARAEETFSRANALSFALATDISVIRYGDDAWTEVLVKLASTRLDLESLSQRSRTAILDKNDENVLEAFQHYQSLKQENLGLNQQSAAFFQDISRQLGIENELNSYYQNALKLAKAQIQTNLDQKNYRDERFIHWLITIPAVYYGGEKKKQDELVSQFLSYEKTKLRDTAASHSFAQVTEETAKSLRTYKQEGFETNWLVKLLERYAQSEMNQAIRKKDLAAFITQAKAYREIKDVLPADSEVLATIDRHLETRTLQAEQYAKSHQFEKALQLYHDLSSLQDTSTLIAEWEERWIAYDPTRLLQVKYPDKTLRSVLSGEDRWGAKVYALGWEEAGQRLYFAAQMPDGSTLYLEQSLEVDSKTASFSLSDALGTDKMPVILVEDTGKERPFSYTALFPDLSQTTLVKRFEIEADSLSAESPDQVIVENSVGNGEKEIAIFKLDDTGLVYEGKKADYLPENAEPSDPSEPTDWENAAIPVPQMFDVHAGPGEEYEIIGQMSGDSSIQVIAEMDGWYQIQFDGREGWIRAPQVSP